MKEQNNDETKSSKAIANQVIQKKGQTRSLPSQNSIQMKKDDELLEKPADGKLPASVQAKMEGALGADFSGVNIHTDSSRSSALKAKAFTQGHDIHFASGKYDPASAEGQKLIGHELTHVVQQRQGRVAPTALHRGAPVNDDTSLENEADVMGSKAASANATTGSGTSAGAMNNTAAAPVQMELTEDEKKYVSSAKPGTMDVFMNWVGGVAETAEGPLDAGSQVMGAKENTEDFLTGVKGEKKKDSYAETLSDSSSGLREMGVASSVGSLLGSTIGGVKKIAGAKEDKDLGKFDQKKGGKGWRSMFTGAGRGLNQAADITNNSLKTTQAISLVTQNAGAFTSAASGLGPMAMITSGFQGIKGVHNAILNSGRQTKAEDMAKNAENDEQRELFEGLAKNKKEKKHSGMADAALGAGGMVAAGLMLNPVTAPAGLAIGAALGLGQGAFSLFKYIRQKGRDSADATKKKAAMSPEEITMVKTKEYEAKIEEGKGSWNPWKRHQASKAKEKLKSLTEHPADYVAAKQEKYKNKKESRFARAIDTVFDSKKSTAEKDKKMEEQATGLQKLSSDPDKQQDAMEGIMGINKYQKGEDGKVATEEIETSPGVKVKKPKTTEYYQNLIFKIQDETVRKQPADKVVTVAKTLSDSEGPFTSEKNATQRLAAAFNMDESAAERELIKSKLK